jgi:lactam utilization protein B
MILQLGAMSEIVRDEAHSVRDVKFFGRRGEPVERDFERLGRIGGGVES